MKFDIPDLWAGVEEREAEGEPFVPDTQEASDARSLEYSKGRQVTFIGDGEVTTNDETVERQQFMQEDEIDFSFGEQVAAFFENDNSAVSSYADDPTGRYQYEYGYDALQDPQTRAYPELAMQFLESSNPEQTSAIINNYMRESRNREIIEESGMVATFGLSAAAILTDPVLLPAMMFTGGNGFMARYGPKATAGLWGSTSGSSEVVAEMIKHDSQTMRTPEETYLNVAAATILPAGLGAWSGRVAQKDFVKAIDEVYSESPMKGVKEPSIPEAEYPIRETDSVGAAAAARDWNAPIEDGWKYEVKSTGTGLEKLPTNPLIRLSRSRVPLARMLAPMLADSPFYYKGFEKGFAVTGEKGSIEAQKREYVAMYTTAMRDIESVYLKSRGLDMNFGGTRALVEDLTGKSAEKGQLSWREFNRNIGDALRNGGQSDNEAVVEAAKIAREKILNPIMEKGIESGVFDSGIRATADNYFPRLFDFDRLAKESTDTQGGFVDKVHDWLKREQAGYAMDKQLYTSRLQHHRSQLEQAESDLIDAKAAAETIGERAREIKNDVVRWNIDINDMDQVKRATRMTRNPRVLSEEDGIRVYDKETERLLEPYYYLQDSPDMRIAKDYDLNYQSTVADIESVLYRELDLNPNAIREGRQYAREMRRVVADSQEKIETFEDFADMTDADLRNLAADIYDSVMGMRTDVYDETLIPDTVAIRVGPLKDRKLKISDNEIRDYLVSDADDVLNYYTKAVSPQLLVAENFGDIQMSRPLESVAQQYRSLRSATEREMRAAGKSDAQVQKELDKMLKEQKRDEKDLIALRDKLYGQYNRPVDPEGFWYNAGEVTKTLNFVRLLGGMTISAIPDISRPITAHGFKPVTGALMAVARDRSKWKANKAELAAANVAIETLTNVQINRFSDLTDYVGKRTKVERGLETASNVFSKMTLMPMWNDTLKGFSGLVTQDQMMRAIKASVEGKASQRQIRELAKYGIGQDDLDGLAYMIGKYGEEGDLWIPNANKWADETVVVGDQATFYNARDLKTKWRSAVSKTVNEVIITPGIGDMPLWMSSPAGSLVTQFKSFAVAAHNKMLVSGLQARDAQVLEGLMFGLLMGSLALETKSALAGREPPSNPGDYVYDSLDRAGWFGWLNEPIQMGAKMSGGALAPNRLWGSERAQVSRYASRNLLGALLGPSTDLLGDLSQVTSSMGRGEWTEGDVTAARKLIPFQNLFYFSWLLQQIEGE